MEVGVGSADLLRRLRAWAAGRLFFPEEEADGDAFEIEVLAQFVFQIILVWLFDVVGEIAEECERRHGRARRACGAVAGRDCAGSSGGYAGPATIRRGDALVARAGRAARTGPNPDGEHACSQYLLRPRLPLQ